ncbi:MULTISPECIES: cytochrome c oxidase subunit II [Pontibacillus]|uniref:Cytochrome c oxidase subunit 2 n=1 Tax=Pontibacillus chungwhensis TaxID=265426 RepID=A0ABY8UWQ6_9BACI|nr:MULTISPECIES: cytochrome c oxidase subunit II [Pontibacillus]MCD5323995.1 cytochrome c oxidase subunit II [Pontibacillus sp. HN14]WIF97942.1 cytochrome c oxidase subunit II [Pontibacillus chungwhensis]
MQKLKLLVISCIVFLTGCNLRVLDPKSETARDQSFLIQFSFALMMIVFAIVIILFIWFISKYKQNEQNKDYIPPDDKGSPWLEITWTVLPFILLAILAVPTVSITFEQSAQIEATPTDAVQIEVTGRQFSWTFSYENGVEAVNDLRLPVDRPVEFTLRSEDVIHSFWIPKLGGKKDLIPGKTRRMIVTPEETGTYQGKCAEFCGREHAQMRFTTTVMEQGEYQQWLEEMKEKIE